MRAYGGHATITIAIAAFWRPRPSTAATTIARMIGGNAKTRSVPRMPLLGIVGLDKARIELDATVVPEEVARYVVGVVRKTRVLEGVMLGASSRAAIHLMSATKANARLEGRDTVSIEDVRTMAQYVLPHRLIVEDDNVSPADALQYALDNPILSEP